MPNELYSQLEKVRDGSFLKRNQSAFACFYEVIIKTELLAKYLSTFKVIIKKEDLDINNKHAKPSIFDKLNVLHILVNSRLDPIEVLQIGKHRNSLAHDFETALRFTVKLGSLIDVVDNIDRFSIECETAFFGNTVKPQLVKIVQSDDEHIYQITIGGNTYDIEKSRLFPGPPPTVTK